MAAAPRRTAEDRARILADWMASGLSAPAFAPQIGVTAHTLYAWRRRARADEGPSAHARFAELVVRRSADDAMPVTGEREPDGRIEIVVGEAVVRVGATFDDDHLRRVLDVVRATA